MNYQHSFTVAAPQSVVRDFHTNATSLGAITPPPVLIKVHSAPTRLAEGEIMDFTMWFGPLPIRWVARFEQVSALGFSDRQLQGPFEKWVHQHNFIPVKDGTTEIVDDIQFTIKRHPWWGLIGSLMALTLPILFAFRAWKTRRLVT